MDELPVARTKSQSAYESLKVLIIRGRLRPDHRISPQDLADRLRLSLTPTREALLRLEAEGYVRQEANRGFFVKPFTIAEQRDLYATLLWCMIWCLRDEGVDAARIGSVGEAVRLACEAHADAPPADAAEAFVSAYDAAWMALAGGLDGLKPLQMQQALDRTRCLRTLDAADPDRRRDVAARVGEICAAMQRGAVIRAAYRAEALRQSLEGRMVALAAHANAPTKKTIAET